MRDIVDQTTRSVDQALKPGSQTGTLSSARTEAWRQRVVSLALVSSDVMLAFFIWGAACLAQILRAGGSLSDIVVVIILPITLVWVGLRAIHGLYPGYGMDEAEELRRQTYALLATLASTAILALAFQVGDRLSRFLLILVFTGLVFLAPLVRHFVKKGLRRHGVWGKPVVMLGVGDVGRNVEKLLDQEWKLGFNPVALFVARPEDRPAGTDENGEPEESVLAGPVELSRKHGVDTLFLAMPAAPQEYATELANMASVHFRNVVLVPDLLTVSSSAVAALNFAGTLGIEFRHNLLDPTVLRAKRAMDVAATVVGGFLILPLLLLFSVLLWVESRGGPVFYKAQRMGHEGRMFGCVKFCTMVPDAENVLMKMLVEDPEAREEYRRYHKLRNDPRITRVGKFLRKTSLDELPQLWNVLRGEMSLVGPRPYLPRESSDIGVAQAEILRVYPGITGPWQVSGRSNTSFPERVQIDVHYVRNWSIWLDLLILARTVRVVFRRREAY